MRISPVRNKASRMRAHQTDIGASPKSYSISTVKTINCSSKPKSANNGPWFLATEMVFIRIVKL